MVIPLHRWLESVICIVYVVVDRTLCILIICQMNAIFHRYESNYSNVCSMPVYRPQTIVPQNMFPIEKHRVSLFFLPFTANWSRAR